jgi:hypothetical protein
MRCLKKNKRRFYYATYTGKTEIEDSQGYATGQYTLTYSKPVEMYANISGGKGESSVETFGKNTTFDRTILTGDMKCHITKTSILWVDVIPEIGQDGTTTTKHDYVVATKPSKTLNSILIAISEVN